MFQIRLRPCAPAHPLTRRFGLAWCWSWLLCTVVGTAAAAGWTAGPLAHEFSLTLKPGTREEWVGPLYYREVSEGQTTWAIPPLWSRTVQPDVEMEEYDILYPLLSYDRFGAEFRWHLFQLLSFSHASTQEDLTAKKFTIFPFYFQSRSADPALNYTALVPFWGTMRNRLLRDEINLHLFPLHSRTVRKDIVTHNFLFPFLHLRHGTQLEGWQFWPLVGHEHRDPFTSTNYLGFEQLTPGHDKFFLAWPFFFNQHTGVGTTNQAHHHALLPAYSHLRSPHRDSSTYH